jgi:hypothetical protein
MSMAHKPKIKSFLVSNKILQKFYPEQNNSGGVFLEIPSRESQLRRMFPEMAHPIDLISKVIKAQKVDTCIKVCF